MNKKALALAVTAGAAAVSVEAINLYRQVMGRGDRPQSLIAKLLTKEDQEKNKQSDNWRKQYVDWADGQVM